MQRWNNQRLGFRLVFATGDLVQGCPRFMAAEEFDSSPNNSQSSHAPALFFESHHNTEFTRHTVAAPSKASPAAHPPRLFRRECSSGMNHRDGFRCFGRPDRRNTGPRWPALAFTGKRQDVAGFGRPRIKFSLQNAGVLLSLPSPPSFSV